MIALLPLVLYRTSSIFIVHHSPSALLQPYSVGVSLGHATTQQLHTFFWVNSLVDEH